MQLRAVVSVTAENSLADVPPVCSGFAIGPRLVLTTSHCWEGYGVVIHVSNDAVTQPITSRVIQSPEPGALLAVMAPGGFEFPEFFSLDVEDPIVGSRVTAGGYGTNAAGEHGKLHFTVEEVESFDAQRVVISAQGRGGLCNGDSGSPLLTRTADGKVSAIGLLLGGSQDCHGTDEFIRTSAMLPWLKANAVLTPTSSSCGAISQEGRCFNGVPTWCANGQLATERCSAGRRCSYSHGGYRCVEAKDDTCNGTDLFGRCDNNAAVRCVDGRSLTFKCACGSSCGYDLAGTAACVTSM